MSTFIHLPSPPPFPEQPRETLIWEEMVGIAKDLAFAVDKTDKKSNVIGWCQRADPADLPCKFLECRLVPVRPGSHTVATSAVLAGAYVAAGFTRDTSATLDEVVALWGDAAMLPIDVAMAAVAIFANRHRANAIALTRMAPPYWTPSRRAKEPPLAVAFAEGFTPRGRRGKPSCSLSEIENPRPGFGASYRVCSEAPLAIITPI